MDVECAILQALGGGVDENREKIASGQKVAVSIGPYSAFMCWQLVGIMDLKIT